MDVSKKRQQLNRSFFSDVFLQHDHHKQQQTEICRRTESEQKFVDESKEQRNLSSSETDSTEYWISFLASQLELQPLKSSSSEDAQTTNESTNVSKIITPDEGVVQEATVRDRTSESLSSCPSVSSTVSSCSGSDSGVPDSNESQKKPTRRAPGSLDINELFSPEAAKTNPSKGYNIKMVKEIHIEDGSIGYGYDKIFADALDNRLGCVFINDPYIRLKSQAANFVVFCELLLANAPNLKRIVLRTQNDPSVDHYALFSNLRWSLFQSGVQLDIERSETIHDREIRFDNGWIYRIGRGLDYFHKQPQLTIGLSNYNLRRCLETTICITKEM